MKFDLKKNKKQKNKTKLIPTEAMGFCEFQAVKFSQSREIYRCTRKRQGCTRNRHTSGRGSPPDRSIRLCAYTHLGKRIYITNVLTSAEERVLILH